MLGKQGDHRSTCDPSHRSGRVRAMRGRRREGLPGSTWGEKNESELITGRRTPEGSIRSDKAIRPWATVYLLRPR